jgi:hypothetical protein
MALILDTNGYPAGSTELPTDSVALAEITISAPPQ